MQGFGYFVGCAGLGMMPAMSKGAAIKPRKTKKNHEHTFNLKILQCKNGANPCDDIVRRNLPKCLPL